MFFLILSILASALIAVVMRLSSDKVRRPLGMLFANYLVCTVLGACYTDFRIFLPEEPGYFTALGLGIFNGFLYLSSFVLYQYNTRKNGIVLSGGETQKLGLSRLFTGQFGLLILDEPSAALDPIAEYELNKVIMELRDTTTIMISHRLSTVRDADCIYLIENGEIAESGSHSQLMKRNGKYAAMFNMQAEKYLETADAE